MLRAVNSNILCKLPTEENVTRGGIILTRRVDEMTVVEVVSVGEGVDEEVTPPCEAGDTILVSYYNTDRLINIDDEQYVFIHFSDVLAVSS